MTQLPTLLQCSHIVTLLIVTLVLVSMISAENSRENQLLSLDDLGEKAVGSPAFFLKIAKNVPRVGRSEKFEDFFLKASKSIPRIGRRDCQVSPTLTSDGNQNPQPFKRRVDYVPSAGTGGRAWQNFPLAIEGPRKLWRSLAEYSHDPPLTTEDQSENEIWSRDKRLDVD